MSIFNSVTITTKLEQIDSVTDILKKYRVIDEGESYSTNEENTEAYFSPEEWYGDIETDLRNALAECKEKGLHLDFAIEFSNSCDGCNGLYTVENGEFVTLTEEEVFIRNAETEDLIAELTRRGYIIANNE